MTPVKQQFHDHWTNLHGMIQGVTPEQWVIAATIVVVLLYGFVKRF